jgi:hypothetical protein
MVEDACHIRKVSRVNATLGHDNSFKELHVKE